MLDRICQAICVFLFLLAGVSLVLSLVFPWYLESDTTGSCVISTTTNFSDIKTQCSTGCGPFIGALCPPGKTDWKKDCTDGAGGQGPANCLRLQAIWWATWVIQIICLAAICLALILYVVHIFGAIKSHFAVITEAFALLLAIAYIVVFSVGLPMAIRGDYIEANNLPSNSACPQSDSPCAAFFGEATRNYLGLINAKYYWGPDLGWYFGVAGGVIMLAHLFVLILFGRKGDSRVSRH